MNPLVVGGTGLLGGAVVDRLPDARPVSRATGFDFFDPDVPRRIEAMDPDRVVLAATVEQASVSAEAYEAAVRRFVAGCEGRRLVYVSSDAVFDGEAGAYHPRDGRTPADQYGRRLAVLERAVAGMADAVTLRPSYLYSADPLDPRLEAAVRTLAEGETYPRYDDVYRSPAHVADVAEAVVALVEGTATGTLHVPGPRLSVYEFHRRALAALGVDTGGLVASEAPPESPVARDRSLVADRFEALTGVEVRPPAESLSSR